MLPFRVFLHLGVYAKADLHWAGLQCRDFHQEGNQTLKQMENTHFLWRPALSHPGCYCGTASVAVQERRWLEQGPPAWFEKDKVNFGGWELRDMSELLLGVSGMMGAAASVRSTFR